MNDYDIRGASALAAKVLKRLSSNPIREVI